MFMEIGDQRLSRDGEGARDGWGGWLGGNGE